VQEQETAHENWVADRFLNDTNEWLKQRKRKEAG
jgi:hypothetical protein